MLYRLTPPETVTWCDLAMPRRIVEIARENTEVNLDGLDWALTEDRAYSADLLRIAVRFGIATRTGIVVEMKHATNVGHADTIRASQMSTDHARADLNETDSMKALHRLFPGMAEHDAELDARVRRSTEAAAVRAERDLADQLARTPADPTLVEHWQHLGGAYPD